MSERTTWKYPLEYRGGTQSIKMPKGALFLTLQLQYGFPTMWFEVDPSKEHEERHFRIFGTGIPLTPSCKVYLGTYQLHGGSIIQHVYEEELAETAAQTGTQFENVYPLQPTGTA